MIKGATSSTPVRAHLGAVLGALAVAAVAFVNAFIWHDTLLIGCVIVGPLLAAVYSGPRDVGAVGVLALVAAFLLAIPDGVFLTDRHLLRLLIVGTGGALAFWTASVRAASQQTEARKAAIMQTALDCVIVMDSEGRVVEFNPAAERTFGYTAAEAIGKELAELIVPPDLREQHRRSLARYLTTGESRILDRRIELRAMRKDGSEFPIEVAVTAIGVNPPLFSGYLRDVTERRSAERRASFLAEAQALLSSSLDYELTLQRLARLAVPFIADWCTIDIVGPDGKLKRLAVAHSDPAKERMVTELEERHPITPEPERGALKAVMTGRSELTREITPQMIEWTARDPEHARLIRRLGLRSAMVVPLLARERALGAITFIAAESRRLFNADDLALAEDLAARAAIAMDNARLYGERSYIASALQQSLLPERLPNVPGVDLAARYYAAGEGNEVGGDFYDIYRAGESTWGLAIGDVRGKGPRAAAVTSLVRYTLRTASLTETRPSRVLAILNEAMLRSGGTDRFCTVAYASIQPADGGVTMTLGVGGHPLPLLLRADGSIERLGVPGTLIGLMPAPQIVDTTIELHPGDSLVLYTDGVLEARSAQGLFGEERLLELLKGCCGHDPAGIAERIEHDVISFQGGAASDDLAVLVMRVREGRRLPGALEADELAVTDEAVA